MSFLHIPQHDSAPTWRRRLGRRRPSARAGRRCSSHALRIRRVARPRRCASRRDRQCASRVPRRPRH
eukprot:1024918-Prymnesium_polylepis.1